MPDTPGLKDREALVLKAVVHSYITTAEPVGSRAIVRRFGLDFSPATVRNVMADLEELGFLQQIHTSSGRVPTDHGYRYYVDYLMHVQKLTLAERARLERELSAKLNDADEVMHNTSQLLALTTQHAAIVEAPDNGNAEVQRVEVMPISPSRAAVLFADGLGRVRTSMVTLDSPLGMDDATRLNRFLNENVRGVRMGNLVPSLRSMTSAILDEQRLLAERAISVLDKLPANAPAQLYLEGATQLFEQPEFRQVDRAREFFEVLDERNRLLELLRESVLRHEAGVASVMIGSESKDEELRDISVVASPYSVGGKAVGVLGVIGPRRMPYSRFASIVNYTAGMLSRFLTRLAG